MKHRNTPYKLNIFALPNQTIILVVLLACVVYGALIAVGATVQPVIFWLLALGLLVLSLRGLLSWPEREFARSKLAPAGEEFAPIQALIARLACDLDLPRAPLLMVSRDDDLRIFGSWRRWYIAMDEGRARKALELLHDATTASQVEAVILHELCHFKHGDHSWTEYARALLHASFHLIAWVMVMLIGILGLLSLAQASFFVLHSPAQLAQRFDALVPGAGQPLATLIFGSTEAWQQTRERAAATDFSQALFNYFMNTFPLFLFGGGLLLVFWQQLMRTREIYADAAVAQAQRRIGSLLGAVVALGGLVSFAKVDSNEQLRSGAVVALGSALAAPAATGARHSFIDVPRAQARMYWRRLRARLARYYLRSEDRVAYLREPQRIYGSWRHNALLIGFFTLVLDLAFLGTSALFYVGEWPLHFPILAAYILIVLALLTPIAIGQPVWRDGLKIVGAVTIIRFMLLLVSLTILIVGFVLFPNLLARLIDVWARGLAGFADLGPDGTVDDLGAFVWKTTQINLLQIPVVFATLLLMVWFSAALARRVLTWYGFPGISARASSKSRAPRTPMHAIYLVIVVLALLLAFGALPLVTDLVLERLSIEVALSRLLVAAITFLVVLPVALWLWRLDRRYARRCPGCGETVPGYYWLGRQCPCCGQLLNPWLLANYDTEAVR